MIDRDITVTVKGRTATLSEEIFVYKNDGAIKYYFNVIDYAYRFSTENMIARAVIKTSNMTILKPNGDSFKTLRKPVVGDTVEFDLSKDLIDEADEVGEYQIQIHLFDLQDNRITIPAFKITVLDTIADVPEPNLAILNASYADKSYLSKEESHIDGPFQPGDLLTADNLNALHKFTLDTCEGTRDYIDQGLAQIKGEKEEIINARGGLHYLKLRLERDKEEVLQIMREDLYKSFKGERISADKSVKGVTKDMVVKGRTYQNLITSSNTERVINKAIGDNRIQTFKISYKLKRNTQYTLICNVLEYTGTLTYGLKFYLQTTGSGQEYQGIASRTGISKKVFSTGDYETIGLALYIEGDDFNGGDIVRFKDCILLEGDWTNKEVPSYVEGIQSVGDKSKNLFNLNAPSKSYNAVIETVEDGVKVYNNTATTWGYGAKLLEVQPNTDYYITYKCSTTVGAHISIRDLNGGLVRDIGISGGTFNSGENSQIYVYMYCSVGDAIINTVVYRNIQLEKGKTATLYNPYYEGTKISILSHNKNIFDGIVELGSLHNSNGANNNDDKTRIRTKNYINIDGMKKVYISSSISGSLGIRYYDSNKIYLGDGIVENIGNSAQSITPMNNAKYMRFTHVDNTDLTTKYLVTWVNEDFSNYIPQKLDKKEILLKEPGTMKYHPEISQGTIQATPDSTTERDDATRVRTGWFKCNNAKPFTVYGLTSTQKVAVLYFNEKKTNIGWTDWQNSVENKTLPSECVYVRAIFANRDNSSCTPEDFSAIFIDVFAIIPCLDGLKSLPNGVCDTLESREDGIYFVKRVGKVFLENLNWTQRNLDEECLMASTPRKDINVSVEKNIFVTNLNMRYSASWDSTEWSKIFDIAINMGNVNYNGIELIVSRRKIPSVSNLDTFKKYLKDNNAVLYYELKEPIETKLYDYYSTNLQTYKDMTYIQGDNFILPEISCEIPVKEQPVSQGWL